MKIVVWLSSIENTEIDDVRTIESLYADNGPTKLVIHDKNGVVAEFDWLSIVGWERV